MPTTSHDNVTVVLYGTTWSRKPTTICALAAQKTHRFSYTQSIVNHQSIRDYL